MSEFLTKKVAAAAVKMWKGRLEEHMKKIGKTDYHVVILDPAAEYQYRPHRDKDQIVRDLGGKDSILYEISYDTANWDTTECQQIGRGKAFLCHREKMNSGDVPRHMLRHGDVKYRGGVYYHGIIVAISGFSSEDDEKFSKEIAHECIRLAEIEFQRWNETHKQQAFV